MIRFPFSISMLRFFSVAIPPDVSMFPLTEFITRLSNKISLMFVPKASSMFFGIASTLDVSSAGAELCVVAACVVSVSEVVMFAMNSFKSILLEFKVKLPFKV